MYSIQIFGQYRIYFHIMLNLSIGKTGTISSFSLIQMVTLGQIINTWLKEKENWAFNM